jgi:hypothetical protein
MKSTYDLWGLPKRCTVQQAQVILFAELVK